MGPTAQFHRYSRNLPTSTVVTSSFTYISITYLYNSDAFGILFIKESDRVRLQCFCERLHLRYDRIICDSITQTSDADVKKRPVTFCYNVVNPLFDLLQLVLSQRLAVREVEAKDIW